MDPQQPVQSPIQPSITPAPSSSASSVPPSTPHKPSWMLLVLGIFVVAIISSGATYLLLGTKATQQPVATPTIAVSPSPTPSQSSAVDTSSWKTHAFSDYSIKAPSDWMQSTSSNPIQLLNYDLNKAPGRDFDSKQDKGMLKVEISSDQTNDTLESYVKKNQNTAEKTNVQVEGQPGIRVKNTYPGFIIYTKHPSKNVIYSISFLLDFDNYQDLANQMLSTLKFL